MLVLKNCFILWICCCIRQQPHDDWSVRHTEQIHQSITRSCQLKCDVLLKTHAHTQGASSPEIKLELSSCCDLPPPHRFLCWDRRRPCRSQVLPRCSCCQPGRRRLSTDTLAQRLRRQTQKKQVSQAARVNVLLLFLTVYPTSHGDAARGPQSQKMD